MQVPLNSVPVVVAYKCVHVMLRLSFRLLLCHGMYVWNICILPAIFNSSSNYAACVTASVRVNMRSCSLRKLTTENMFINI